MSEPPIQDVSDTAFMVAAYRARESDRRDALFHDPFAARLAGAHGREIVARVGRAFLGGWSVAIRTVVIDELVQAAVEGGVDTVLCLGAGLDARPHRLPLPSTLRWVEVDYAKVIALKERVLASERPHCRLERVGLDLADVDARRRLLDELDAHAASVLVLTEGVVPYLDVAAVGALADDLRRMRHARGWIVDYFPPETVKYRQSEARKRHLRNAPFRFAPADWQGFFAEHGWTVKELRDLAAEGVRLGRPIRLPVAMRALLWARTIFMRRARGEGPRRFPGYALLAPD